MVILYLLRMIIKVVEFDFLCSLRKEKYDFIKKDTDYFEILEKDFRTNFCAITSAFSIRRTLS